MYGSDGDGGEDEDEEDFMDELYSNQFLDIQISDFKTSSMDDTDFWVKRFCWQEKD